MTVIQAAPRVPKGSYRPAPVYPPYEERQDFYESDLLSEDPTLHPTYAKAYRRPPSPIAEGRFDPNTSASPTRRSRSVSTKRTLSSNSSRSRSVPVPAAEPVPISSRVHASPSSMVHPPSPPSARSSRRGSPHSVASSSPPETPSTHSPVMPAAAPVFPSDVPPVAPVPALTRPSKLRKPRRSSETVLQATKSQERELRGTSTVVESPTSRTQSAKQRSAFSRLRFGKPFTGRASPQAAPGIGTRRLSEASSYVVVDASDHSIAEGPVEFYPRHGFEPDADSGSVMPPRVEAPSIHSMDSGSQAGQAPKASPVSVNLDQIDELDETDPSGFAWHNSGPYDAIRSTVGSRVGGSAVGSQVGSQVGASRQRQGAPSISASSVHTGHRMAYPNPGAPRYMVGAPIASPYPAGMAFIPEALPAAQAKVYSDASHSRSGSSNSPHHSRSGSGSGDHMLPVPPPQTHSQSSRDHGFRNGFDEPSGGEYLGPSQWDRGERRNSSYSDLYRHPDDTNHDVPPARPIHNHTEDDDDFYSAPRFQAPADEHSYSARDSHWGDADRHLYPRRSRDEDVKFVPAPTSRQPLLSPADDHHSHTAHHSQVYSEHGSHRRGPSSLQSGNSGGSRGPMPRAHVPQRLVMPSPLQKVQAPSHGRGVYYGSGSPPRGTPAYNYSPPGAPHGAGYGYGAAVRTSVSPARHSVMAPSWQSSFAHQNEMAPSHHGNGGRLFKRR